MCLELVWQYGDTSKLYRIIIRDSINKKTHMSKYFSKQICAALLQHKIVDPTSKCNNDHNSEVLLHMHDILKCK